MSNAVLKRVSPSDWLSLSRIPLGLLFPFVGLPGRIFILILAGASDLLDGILARRYGWGTPLGKVVDPLSDKVFAFICAATLLIEGTLPLSSLPFFFARDIALLAFAVVRKISKHKEPLKLQGIIAGKLFTTLQFILLFALVAGRPYPPVLDLFFFGLGVAAFIELFLTQGTRDAEDTSQFHFKD